MRAKVYCLASAKGGSGKTTLCASFASILSAIGQKILIVDLDAATNGLTLLYLNEVNNHRYKANASDQSYTPSGLFERRKISIDRDIVLLPNQVSLLPATYSFGNHDDTTFDLLSVLRPILEEVSDKYDLIFLDAQAGTDLFSRIAMNPTISDEVVIVSEYDPLSAAGVERMKARLRDDLGYSRTWMLLNKMLPEFVSSFSEFLEVIKYLAPIPWDSNVVRAYARRELPIDLAKGNRFTVSIIQGLKTLLGSEVAQKISDWSEWKASQLKEPIEDQYHDAQMMLNGLIQDRGYILKSSRREQFFRILSLLTAFIMITVVFVGIGREGSVLKYISESSTIIERILPIGIGIAGVITLLLFFSSRLIFPKVSIRAEKIHFEIIKLREKIEYLNILRNADLDTFVQRREDDENKN